MYQGVHGASMVQTMDPGSSPGLPTIYYPIAT